MSFLSDYREFTKGSEAHPTYHTFSALVALGSIISRKVWLELGYFDIYPNLYVVLVGPPGNRKTSAMEIAQSLVREIGGIPATAEKTTKEKLVLDMLEQERVIANLPSDDPHKVYTPMTIFSSEFSEFLGSDSGGMINFLTTIYGLKVYDSRTKNKGDVAITGPYLSLISCTTPDWITTYLRSDVISGGFSRRAIFVLETGKSARIAIPTVTPEAKAGWKACIDYAKRLQQVSGPFVWDPKAKDFYINWYNTLVMPTDETVVGYYETKHMQLLKISMLVALSESTDLVLRLDHLLFGLELLKLAETNLVRVFAGIGRNELNTAATKVLELMDKLPAEEKKLPEGQRFVKIIDEKKLLGMMYHIINAQEFNDVIRHLCDTDRLGRVQSGGPVPRTLIYLK